MQKHVNLVDLVKSFPTNIFLQNLASIQQRKSLVKFDHLESWMKNQSKVRDRTFQLREKHRRLQDRMEGRVVGGDAGAGVEPKDTSE